MVQFYSNIFLIVVTIAQLFSTSTAINCHQCDGGDSKTPFQCNEWLSNDIDIKPVPCDNVYDAKYCIKHIGRYEASAILCYQCSAGDTIHCTDPMIRMNSMTPKSCDHVFEAEYCIKSTSLDGGIGAKRFCSSLDFGNYCNYVRQPGDILRYRTCVFTCTGDGCNSASSTRISWIALLTAFIFGILTLNNCIVR